MEISARVPVNAVISLLQPECSRELREGAAAMSSLCGINAIILYQRSLGITFYAKCFQTYLFFFFFFK